MSHEKVNQIHHHESPPAGHYDLEGGAPIGRQLSVQLTPEQFEKLYLQPGGVGGKGDLSKRIGNPTPLGLLGFLLCLTPVSGFLMGWGGTSLDANAALSPVFIFFGFFLLALGGIFELIIGNTFPSVVFLTFASFWGVFGLLNLPIQGIAAAYPEGAASLEFNHGLAIYFCWWALLNFIFNLAALRTNVVFVVLFACLEVTFCIIAAIYFYVGSGTHVSELPNLMKACGAFGFLTCLCGWYLVVALLFASTGMPISLPVGDLSGFLSGKRKAH